MFWVFMGIVCPIQAQVVIGGLADFEIRKGGSDSSPYVNQTPNANWSVYTPYLRLFIQGDLSEKWFISAALQADHYEGTKLSPVFFSLMNINYLPFQSSNFTVSAGRIVIPYGAYSKRVLSSENPFVHLPLTHAAGLPISKTHGTLYNNVDYGEDVNGLTMIYQRMYTQGVMVKDRLGENEWLQYELAATLASASSFFEYGEHSKPAFTGRVVLHPVVWGSVGFSLSSGPFLKKDVANGVLSDEDLSKYTQTLIGTDLQLSYHYLTFLASYNWSEWKTPYFNPETTPRDYLWDDRVEVQHISTELIADFAFFPGAYAGIRLERLLPGDISSYSDITNPVRPWSYDRDRVELVTGIKLQRNVIFKASYLFATDNGPNLKDDVFTLQISAGF
jgi:hypothetical protein